MQGDQNTAEINGTVLALDVGGNFIKSGLILASGRMEEFSPVPVDSEADAAAIIGSFSEVIRTGFREAGGQIETIGVAIPGPFDYARGVSLMTHKFAAIKDMRLVAALCAVLPEMAGIPIRFRHDANAFLAGEMWRGAGQGVRRALGVTLGTGVGVACCVAGRFITNALGSPAPEVSMWQRPLKDKLVEDYVSTRALVTQYLAVRPDYDPARGARGLAEAAQAGNHDALRLFASFGENLGNALVPLCETLCPERIILGGQIAKDFVLFEKPLRTTLRHAINIQRVISSQLGNRAALWGAILEECRTAYSAGGIC